MQCIQPEFTSKIFNARPLPSERPFRAQWCNPGNQRHVNSIDHERGHDVLHASLDVVEEHYNRTIRIKHAIIHIIWTITVHLERFQMHNNCQG